jgi:hypothetical protein
MTPTTAPTNSASLPSLSANSLPSDNPGNNPCIKAGLVYCALNPMVQGDAMSAPNNFNATICNSGWTAAIRPPESWTNQYKTKEMNLHGFYIAYISNYELDHRMPLELGGAPGSPDPSLSWENVNLSLESPASPNPKDTDETILKKEVCHGQLTLSQARQELIDKWLLPDDKYKK